MPYEREHNSINWIYIGRYICINMYGYYTNIVHIWYMNYVYVIWDVCVCYVFYEIQRNSLTYENKNDV